MFTHPLRTRVLRIIQLVGILFLLVSALVYAQDENQIVNTLSWNLDGTKLAIGFMGGELEIVDTAGNQTVTTFQLAQHGFRDIHEVAWNPVNSNLLAVAGGDIGNRQARVWVFDVDKNTEIFTFDGVQAVRSIAWSPDGTRLAISVDFIADNLGNRTVQIWDIASNQLMVLISTGANSITDVAWSPDGSQLAGASSDATIIIWDATTGETTQTLMGHTAIVTDVAWSPDGATLATASEFMDSTIRLWNIETGEIIWTTPNLYSSVLAWSPDGNQLAALNIAREVDVLDAASGQMIDTFPEGAFANSVTYSPFGGRLVFAGQPNAATQLSNNRSVQTFANGAVQIVVPAPSLERLRGIGRRCNAPGNVMRTLNTPERLPAFVTQIRALPAAQIPPACAADLIAVAEALQNP